MRIVRVSKYERVKPTDAHLTLVPDGTAIFHKFGVNYEEFESGPGHFTTAVIERADGSVQNIPCEMVQFIDADPGQQRHQ